LRSHFDDIEIDPVLPHVLDQTICELTQNGRRVRYHFRVQQGECSPPTVSVNGRPMPGTRVPNPYRTGGLRIPKTEFQSALSEGDNQVEILL
jgi:cellobiose phosphorylase